MYNRTTEINFLIYGNEPVSASDACFRIPGDVLTPRGLYRYSVCAKIDGKNVWSEERYFYVSSHQKLTSTFNFHVYNGFSDATKNAAYYVTQTWANALGQSYAATYPFSQGTDDVGTNSAGNDIGSNGRNVISVGWYGANSSRVAVTRTFKNTLGTVVEKDIYLNRDKTFANSAKPGAYDVQSIFAHEMGHVYGLCDKYEVGNGSYGAWARDWTMFSGSDGTNSIALRSLDAYDIRHVKWLYDAI